MRGLRESDAVCLHLFFGPWLVRRDLRRRERSLEPANRRSASSTAANEADGGIAGFSLSSSQATTTYCERKNPFGSREALLLFAFAADVPKRFSRGLLEFRRFEAEIEPIVLCGFLHILKDVDAPIHTCCLSACRRE